MTKKVETIEKKQEEEIKKQTAQRQYERKKNIEIHGIETESNENLQDIMKKIADQIEIKDFDVRDIEMVHRLPNKNRNNNKHKDETRVKESKKNTDKEHESVNRKLEPIIVQFKSRKTREEWITKRKIKLTNEDIFGTGEKGKIYINEYLTPEIKRLLWLTKQRAREKQWKFIWCKEGKIFGRKKEGEKVIRVWNEDDLKKIV